MDKPQTLNAAHGATVTENAERVLVTLLRGLGPWRDSLFLVGGLAPRYIVEKRPPDVPWHAGTGDVDVVIDIGVLADTEAYATLEDNLRRMKFVRGVNREGIPVGWRWQARLDGGGTMVLEFLAEAPEGDTRVLKELPGAGAVSAANIPHAAMVLDLHDRRTVTAELLGGGGIAIETIAFANLVSFTSLKVFAFDDRAERKDAHDLVYCLEHATGGVAAAAAKFRDALAGPHADAIRKALALLRKHFASLEDDSYKLNGPVAVSMFELGEDADAREMRLLRQRQVAETVGDLLAALDA